MTEEQVEQEVGFARYTGFTRFRKAAYFSYKGFLAAYKYEEAFRLELFFTAIFLPLAIFLPVTVMERVALIGALFFVLIVELLNSAVETVVDRVGLEKNELSGRAKDIASAAVFLSIILWALIWGSILYGYIPLFH